VGALVADYFRAYRWRWIVGVLFTVVSTVFGLVTPWLLRQAIDTFATPGGSQLGWGLPAFAAAIVVVALFEGASRFLARLIITGASRWVEYDLRNRYFQHLETLEPAFFVRYRTGDLVARATNDLSAVRQLFGPALYHIVNTTLLTVLALVLMFQLSPSMAIWAALVVPIAVCVFLLSHRQIERRFTRVQEQFAAMADHCQETFAGQRVIKAYAQEPDEGETFSRTSHEYVRRQLSQIKLTGLLWPTMTLIVGLLTVLILYRGGHEVANGQLTLGEFVQFMAYVTMLSWPMISLGWLSSFM
jgi:ATP-binding cassette subfamily B protein